MEKTCVLIKPDAMKKGFAGSILSRFENIGMRIIGCKLMQLDDVLLREHYANVAHEDFFEDLKKFMKSAPILALALQGENAVATVREIAGKNFLDSGTIRGEFAENYRENAIHSSDRKENAEAEIYRFFDEGELFRY
jgi:nucleoside-diphosphate kinase